MSVLPAPLRITDPRQVGNRKALSTLVSPTKKVKHELLFGKQKTHPYEQVSCSLFVRMGEVTRRRPRWHQCRDPRRALSVDWTVACRE